jgi:hypothetical protein
MYPLFIQYLSEYSNLVKGFIQNLSEYSNLVKEKKNKWTDSVGD